MASIHPFTSRAAASFSDHSLPALSAALVPCAATRILACEIIDAVQYLAIARPDTLAAIRDMAKYLTGTSLVMLGISVWAWFLIT